MTPTQIRSLLDDLFVFGTLTFDELTESLAQQLIAATKDAYYNTGAPLITDAQYDQLEQHVGRRYTALAPEQNTGAPVRGRNTKLPIQMGGLTQLHEETQLLSWRVPGKYVLSDKLDGNSILLHYVNGMFKSAMTRGDGTMGKDVTQHLQQMTFPRELPGINREVFVRCEAIIRNEQFDEIVANSDRAYKNARNTVAGLLNTIEPNHKLLSMIDIVAYQIIGVDVEYKQQELLLLVNLGFNTVRYQVVDGKRLTFDFLAQMLVINKETSPYELDGIVIDVDSTDQRNKMRSNSMEPEFARKFKVNNQSVESVVVDVEWSVSKDGYVKPTVVVEPVDLLGVTIRRATGHNARNIYDMKICPGAGVEITRQGDVIPSINAVTIPSSTGEEYDRWFNDALTEAVDQWTWNATEVDVVLADTNNPLVRQQMLIHVMNALEIDQMREGNVIKMFNQGYETFEQLLEADTNDFVNAIGSNGAIAYTSFAKKLQSIKIEELMVASGLFGRGIGIKKLRKALEVVDGDFTKLASIELASVEGFHDKTADRVMSALPSFIEFFQQVQQSIAIAPFHTTIEGKFSGQVVVFTGFRDNSLKQQLIELGAQVVDSYTKKVTMVIARDPNDGSTKLTKARANGAVIIGLDEIESQL